jgi:hypothetical protein
MNVPYKRAPHRGRPVTDEVGEGVCAQQQVPHTVRKYLGCLGSVDLVTDLTQGRDGFAYADEEI